MAAANQFQRSVRGIFQIHSHALHYKGRLLNAFKCDLRSSAVRNLLISSCMRYPSFDNPDGTEERRPVSHKLDIPNSYLTSFPHLTREELEEPPPRVSAPVARILENSRMRFIDGKLRKPKYNARKLARLRKQYIAQGYYWPEKPMRDRQLDMAPADSTKEKRRLERKQRIEEAMKNMPNIVAAYRKKVAAFREKKREEKEKNKLKIAKIQALGLHPNDPKAKRILHEGTEFAVKKEEKNQNKKKFQNKAK